MKKGAEKMEILRLYSWVILTHLLYMCMFADAWIWHEKRGRENGNPFIVFMGHLDPPFVCLGQRVGNIYHSKSHLNMFPIVKKTLGATKLCVPFK